MNNFMVIYKILKTLEKAMDFEEFDDRAIEPEVLNVSKERRDKLLIEMQREGYITGLNVDSILGVGKFVREPLKISITIKGLEYLYENSFMKKAADTARGVIETLKP